MRRERRRDRSLFEPRSAPVRDFAAQAEAVASLVHPVIVGKRALPQTRGRGDTGPRPGRADWGNPAA
jgi:hypothetical protein